MALSNDLCTCQPFEMRNSHVSNKIPLYSFDLCAVVVAVALGWSTIILRAGRPECAINGQNGNQCYYDKNERIQSKLRNVCNTVH